MHPYESKDDEQTKYEEVCEIATIIRQFKDKVVMANENFSDILRRVEL